MANSNRNRLQRERQYSIDQITARYVEEYRAGNAPRLDDYVRRYPEFATEIADFVVYFHAVAEPMPQVDAEPAAELSAAARVIQARIREEMAFPGLVARARVIGLTPPALAVAVGISMDVLGKLESHVIAAASIPPTLVRRLAESLRATPEAIATYLGGVPLQAGSFFYAERAPERKHESFLAAIQASASLSASQKQEWEQLVTTELEDSGSNS